VGLLGKPVEYADNNIDGVIIGIISFERSVVRSVVTHTFVFEGRRVEVADLTEIMDFLSKRINASRPLYFYENV
jgi:hypothetical protein